MIRFFREYPLLRTKVPQPVAQLTDHARNEKVQRLVASLKKILAEYALRGMNKPIGVSEYELTRTLPDELKSSLPSIEDIEKELTEQTKMQG